MKKGYFKFLIPGLILFIIFIIFPVIANIGLSFTEWTGIGKPVWIGIDNYVKIANDPNFFLALLNNVILVVVITIIPTIVGLLLATFILEYISIKFNKGLANFLRGGFYFPQVIPIVIVSIMWRWLLQPDWGVANTLLDKIGLGKLAHNWLGDSSTAFLSIIIMMIWAHIGYSLIIFVSALQRVDPVLYEAAELDGATFRQRFLKITIYLIKPEIFVVVVTTIVHALLTFAQVYVMTNGGPGTSTFVISFFSYINFFEYNRVGYGAAASTLLTIIVILTTVSFLIIQTRQER